MKKFLLTTTVVFTALFGNAAFAGDPSYPGVIERGTSNDWATQVQTYHTLQYFENGRATGRVPPAPDSTSVTVDDRGRTSTTQTWNKR